MRISVAKHTGESKEKAAADTCPSGSRKSPKMRSAQAAEWASSPAAPLPMETLSKNLTPAPTLKFLNFKLLKIQMKQLRVKKKNIVIRFDKQGCVIFPIRGGIIRVRTRTCRITRGPPNSNIKMLESSKKRKKEAE